MDWQDNAPCNGLGELFFPDHAERPEATAERERIAFAICADCPYRDPCTEIAWSMGPDAWGIFGGRMYWDRATRNRRQRTTQLHRRQQWLAANGDRHLQAIDRLRSA